MMRGILPASLIDLLVISITHVRVKDYFSAIDNSFAACFQCIVTYIASFSLVVILPLLLEFLAPILVCLFVLPNPFKPKVFPSNVLPLLSEVAPPQFNFVFTY
jgi:hypothetical protein